MTKNLLTFKNKKLGCPSFPLPRGITCKPGLECSKYCYANKGNYLYKTVKEGIASRLPLSQAESFIQQMIQEISKRKFKYVRLHSSGDFYSTEYIQKWYDIAHQLPQTKFYAYTKRDDLFSKKLLSQKPSNLILIFSFDGIDKVIPDSLKKAMLDKGFDKVAIVSSKTTNCHAQKNKSFKCGLNCFKCMSASCKAITFKKH